MITLLTRNTKYVVGGKKKLICTECSHNTNCLYKDGNNWLCKECRYGPFGRPIVMGPPEKKPSSEKPSLAKEAPQSCPTCFGDDCLYKTEGSSTWFCIECLWESVPNFVPVSSVSIPDWETFPLRRAERRRLATAENIFLDGESAFIWGTGDMVAFVKSVHSGKECMFLWPTAKRVIDHYGGKFLSSRAL